jgi:hypothetical protein
MNFQFDYDISLRKSNQTEDNDLQTNSVTFDATGDKFQSNSIKSFKKQNPIAVNQSMNIFWTQNKKKVLGRLRCNIYIKMKIRFTILIYKRTLFRFRF